MKLKDINKGNNCPETELLIDSWLDDEISSEEKIVMESHLKGCAACRSYLEETVILLESAGKLQNNRILEKKEKEKLWKAIESRINSSSSGTAPVYSIYPSDDQTGYKKAEKYSLNFSNTSGSLKYYFSGIAAVFAIALLIYGAVKSINKDTSGDNGPVVDVSLPGWTVSPVKGNPILNGSVIQSPGSLEVGGTILTDNGSRAELSVAGLGTIIIEPDSKVKLIKNTANEKRILIEYGSLDADIIAKPRTFFVDAAGVTAVDLGCSYRFVVDEKGDGLLYVRSGRVALESAGGRQSIVPAGKFCATRKDVGPGTPFREDSSPELKKALMEFDFGNCADKCIKNIIKNAKQTDAVTLVNIIPRVDERYKTVVYRKVCEFVSPPSNFQTDSFYRFRVSENTDIDINQWVDRIMIELNQKMRKMNDISGYETEKGETNLDKSNKQMRIYHPKLKDTIIINNVPSPEEMDIIRKDIDEIQKEIKKDNETFKKEMHRVKEDIKKITEEVKKEMEQIQKEFEENEAKKKQR